jgi:hypothetical protein
MSVGESKTTEAFPDGTRFKLLFLSKARVRCCSRDDTRSWAGLLQIAFEFVTDAAKERISIGISGYRFDWTTTRCSHSKVEHILPPLPFGGFFIDMNLAVPLCLIIGTPFHSQLRFEKAAGICILLTFLLECCREPDDRPPSIHLPFGFPRPQLFLSVHSDLSVWLIAVRNPCIF